MSDIGVRAKKILHAVVSEYLATGEAVGSQTVTRRYGLDVSAATVRNVMGDLEGMGLLKHTHTSGGRIPTDRGLRYYVDTLLRVRSLAASEQEEIRERLTGVGERPELMQRTTRVLRELSHLAVVVQTPRPESDVIEHIEFVRLREGQLLAVIATVTGHIQNKLVPIDFQLPPGDLDQIHNYLNGLVGGLTLEKLQARLTAEIEKDRSQHDELANKALRLAAAAMPEGQPQVLIDGQSNLLSDGTDMDRAKVLLRTLEEKDLLVKLLERTLTAPGICVFIGAEANLADLTDISVVAASYGGDDHPLGTIGVIGPSRMNYSRLISLVDFTAEMITESLGKS
ncbi:MAG: heat-inducible transcription repressor HrcA [Deltaproteobacteria bacterium]|nr:heat-inducible transcription repressor HrcA [Deltaproteobacteria bacterium]